VIVNVRGRGCPGYRGGWQGVAVLGMEEGGRAWLYWIRKRVEGRGCTGYGRGWQGVAVLDREEGVRARLYWIRKRV
jgi:hypothetical protein